MGIIRPLLLIVEDDAVTRLMLCRFLQKQGYETVEAKNGEEAISAFEERTPDVVLMDAKMPIMDGFTSCRELKSRPEAKHVPFIMITGLNDDESVDKAFKAGAIDFITKPIHWAILRNRVRYLIKNVQAERELYLAASVFDNTTEGIVVTDAQAVIQSLNPAFLRITGYAEDEVIGKKMSLLKSGRHDPDFYKRMWSALTETGKWQGEIWNRRKSGEVYPEWINISAIRDPLGKIVNYVAVFADLTSIKESEESLAYITGHDPITDLPNRILFTERLNQSLGEAERLERMVGVILLDLDRFKVFNETMGHDVGDRLLAMVGERLSACIPSIGTLARMGGDEFGVIFPKIPNPNDAGYLAKSMLDELIQPFNLDGLELSIGASVGISVFPLDGRDVKTLMKNADAAMYHAKEQGRNNFQFYRDELNTNSLARILLESSLRTALEREEFLLHYQPQVDIPSGRLVGMEALVRWRHPGKGMVSPGEFIPLAEETGLIVPIGEWVLREACRQNKAWLDEGFPPMRVAVNLSSMQFHQPNLVRIVASILKETGLDPHLLELELTESIAMREVEQSMTTMKQISDMGIRLALDDFGTGFSSLSYLKRFPIHTLKVDQAFVRSCTEDPDDAAIIRTVIGLAQSLGLKVVAEGVEQVGQLEFLRRHNCDQFQGYLYSRPLPAGEFVQLLEERMGYPGG